VHLIDMDKAFDAQPKASASAGALLLADQLHLGPGGHEIYFQTVWPALLEAVHAMLTPGHSSALERG
jgi:hypothetical protein